MIQTKYGYKIQGFYLIGFFSDNLPAQMDFSKEKPFVTDENGFSSSKCFPSYPQNQWAKEWLFFKTETKIKDICDDTNLKDNIEDTWKEWCIKYKRKHSTIFIKQLGG